LISASLCVSCDRSASSRQRVPEPELLGVGADTDAARCVAPLRVVVFQDKTASGTVNRTPQVGVGDLEPLIDHVVQCGGEVALGVIESRSNTSLARLYVAEPPSPPAAPVLVGTPFEVLRERRRHQAELARYARAAASRMAGARSLADSFRAGAVRQLATPRDPRRTDVWGAIARAAAFLMEPGDWERPPYLATIVVSDAIDNVGAPKIVLPAAAHLYLVNGAPSLGALEILHPTQVEAVAAAVRRVVNHH
jgi:hypothetical protein